jgi:O-antigen ligase
MALGATVFCTVLGSSSVPELVSVGRKLRWGSLFVLLVLGAWLALREMRRPPRVTLVVLGLGAWLAALGLVSAAWSVDPSLTIGRAGSFTLMLLAAAALALAASSRPRMPACLLYGILGGVAAAALGGLAVLALRHQDALQAASATSPTRYRGLGENPNTVPLLIGVTAPVALWALLRARSLRGRIALTLVLVLLVGSLAASQSRGGVAAAGIGCGVQIVLLLPRWPRRVIVGGALALVVAAAVIALPSASPNYPASRFQDAHYIGRLADELDFHKGVYHRSLLGSSGRIEAWRGALDQIGGRPLLGYGFGTEDHVFVDRFYDFEGGHVENSFLGMGLQLGILGVASLLALFGGIAVAAVQALRRRQKLSDPAPALAAVGIAGLVLMCVQSFVYSVGDVATVSFWVMVFLLTSSDGRRQLLVHEAPGQNDEQPTPRAPAPVATP